MKIMRVYSGADGQSHFDEIEVEIEKLQPAEGIIFRHVPPDYVNSWHTAPRRQYVINLSGEARSKSAMAPSDASVLVMFIWLTIPPVKAISRVPSVTSRASL